MHSLGSENQIKKKGRVELEKEKSHRSGEAVEIEDKC